MAEKRVIIIHGLDAGPQMHWFPWIKEKLEKKGFIVHIPQMPGGENPKCEECCLKEICKFGKANIQQIYRA